MKGRHNGLLNWVLCYSLGMLIIWIPVLLLVGHFVLGLPYHSVVQPAVVIAVVLAAFGPLFWWAGQTPSGRSRESSRIDKVAAGFMAAVLILFSVYGWYLGMLAPSTAWLVGILSIAIAVPSGYFFGRRLRSRAFGHPDGMRGSGC